MRTSVREQPTRPELAGRGVTKIRLMEDADSARWDDFVMNTAGGTFYHLSGWKTLIEEQLHHPAHYLLSETNGQITAVLPLVHVSSMLFGNTLMSLPFLVYGGPIASDDISLHEIVNAARTQAESLGVDYLELRNRRPLEGEWLMNSNYVTFCKTIEPEPDANMKGIPRKQRAMIRKGIKAGLTAEIDNDAERLHKAMLECKRNLGTPFFGKSWLAAIKKTFETETEITTITRNGRIICSVMTFLFKDQVLPYYGGGGIAARDVKGNDFMYWSVMEKACKDGYRIFDFGRSAVGSGAYRFKKHWGFEPEPLAYQVALVSSSTVPNLSPSNPKYRALIEAWKRLPLSVAGVLGPPIARRIG